MYFPHFKLSILLQSLKPFIVTKCCYKLTLTCAADQSLYLRKNGKNFIGKQNIIWWGFLKYFCTKAELCRL